VRGLVSGERVCNARGLRDGVGRSSSSTRYVHAKHIYCQKLRGRRVAMTPEIQAQDVGAGTSSA